MYDVTTRLAVAYGLIAMLVIVALALVLWRLRNTWQRRDARDRERLARSYRRRDEVRPTQRAPGDDEGVAAE